MQGLNLDWVYSDGIAARRRAPVTPQSSRTSVRSGAAFVKPTQGVNIQGRWFRPLLDVAIYLFPFIYLLVFFPLSDTFWEALSGRINTGKSRGSRRHILWLMEAVTHRAAALLPPSSRNVLWTKEKEEADEIGTSSLKLLSDKGHVHTGGTGGRGHLSKSLMSRTAASMNSGSRGKQGVVPIV